MGFKKGNLFITLFLKLDKIKINYRQFAVLNAFLLKKLISKIVQKKITIKWPNDLLFNKHKFCGILQEIIKYDKFSYLIIGIGLNTNVAPKNKSFKSTCLKNIINRKINNQQLLKNILKVYEKFLNKTKSHDIYRTQKEIVNMHYIVGDIGNTSTRICLLNKNFKIIKSIVIDTKKIFIKNT